MLQIHPCRSLATFVKLVDFLGSLKASKAEEILQGIGLDNRCKARLCKHRFEDDTLGLLGCALAVVPFGGSLYRGLFADIVPYKGYFGSCIGLPFLGVQL